MLVYYCCHVVVMITDVLGLLPAALLLLIDRLPFIFKFPSICKPIIPHSSHPHSQSEDLLLARCIEKWGCDYDSMSADLLPVYYSGDIAVRLRELKKRVGWGRHPACHALGEDGLEGVG